MEATEAKIIHMYEWVDKYRQEFNISPGEWATHFQTRTQFWEWLKQQKGAAPMLVLWGINE